MFKFAIVFPSLDEHNEGACGMSFARLITVKCWPIDDSSSVCRMTLANRSLEEGRSWRRSPSKELVDAKDETYQGPLPKQTPGGVLHPSRAIRDPLLEL